MKAKHLLLATTIFSVLTAGAFAATPVQNDEGLNRIGSVSASGVTTLSALENLLAKKAEDAGASSYRIVSAGGENKLHGVAIIYK